MTHGLSVKALISVVVWGLSFVATKIALTWLTPFGLVAGRFALGFATLAAIMILARRPMWPGTGDRARCVLLGAILAGHILLQGVGLLKTSATNTGWIIGFTPITIALGGALFLRQTISRRVWLGILLGSIGVLLIFLSSGKGFGTATIGDLMQLGSCLTWTAYTLLAIRPVARQGAAIVTLAAIGTAALVMLPLAATRPCVAGPVSIRTVVALLFLGLICSGVAFWLWFAAVSEIGSARTGMYLYLEPFVTLLAASVILDERLAVLGMLGGLSVLCGVWIVSKGRRPAQPAARQAGEQSG